MNFGLKWAAHLLVVALHAAGLLLFCRGFFPLKQVLPGTASFLEPHPFGTKAPFQKVVVMVVDAMRLDMFYGPDSHMSFLHGLINQGCTLPYTAHAHPPTVTLPRLKGITTGLTPLFLDAILNINEDDTTLLAQDSWVTQFMGDSGARKVHFYGDDTWIKLFPTQFAYQDGTNLFYVLDFTEVDHNVTRHLDRELTSSHWDGLILHYLGLDHIGHKGGPRLPHMPAKQREMDAIVERLYGYVEKHPDTLLVVLGDHGMNEIGNHGGALAGEVSPGMVLVSPKFKKLGLSHHVPQKEQPLFAYFEKCLQIDLVPTLLALLGIPIPKNNVGRVLPEILGLFKDPVKVLRENARQMAALAGSEVEGATVDELSAWLTATQEQLALAATNYNDHDMYAGLAMLVAAAVLSVGLYWNYYCYGTTSALVKHGAQMFALATVVYAIHFHGSSLIEEEHHIWWIGSVLATCVLGLNRWSVLTVLGMRLIKAWANTGQKHWLENKLGLWLMANPDHLWLAVASTYIFVALLCFSQGNLVSALNFFLGGALARDFKQVGLLLGFILTFLTMTISFAFKLLQFWNDGHEIPPWLRWLYYWILSNNNINPHLHSAGEDKAAVAQVLVLVSNTAVYFMGLLVATVMAGGKAKGIKGGYLTVLTNFLTLYLIHHTRVEYIPMFAVYHLIKYAFTQGLAQQAADVDGRIVKITVFTLAMANLLFFSLGFTNLLATVDLANAYNGVRLYNLYLVGLLTFVANYAGPLFWLVLSLQMLYEPSRIVYGDVLPSDLVLVPKIRQNVFLVKQQITTMFYAVLAVSLVALCINLRFHLFIWTVFSPKVLFFGVWSLFVGQGIDLVVGELLMWII